MSESGMRDPLLGEDFSVAIVAEDTSPCSEVEISEEGKRVIRELIVSGESSASITKEELEKAKTLIQSAVTEGCTYNAIYEYLCVTDKTLKLWWKVWLWFEKGQCSSELAYVASLADSEVNNAPPPVSVGFLFNHKGGVYVDKQDFDEIMDFFVGACVFIWSVRLGKTVVSSLMEAAVGALAWLVLWMVHLR